MNQGFSDELISAYLDGELTSEEQAQVEQLLVDSAEHRQMFEELRALRASLQALPSYELDDEFADRVLQRAEREMESQQSVSPPAHSDGGNWRVAVIAITSVAAALLVSLLVFPNSDQHEHFNVANLPKTDELAEEAREAEEDATVWNGVAAEGNEVVVDEPVDDEPVANNAVKEVQDILEDASSDRPLAAAQPAAAQPIVRTSDEPLRKSTSSSFPKKDTNRLKQQVKQINELERVNGRVPPTKSTARDKTDEEIAKSSEVSPAQTSPVVSGIQPQLESKLTTAESAIDRYVVMVDFTKNAFENGVFDQALQRNGISLTANEVGESLAEELDGEKVATTTDQSNRKMASGNVDVMILEAPITKIQATLTELSNKGHLVAVSVHPELAGQGAHTYEQGVQNTPHRPNATELLRLPESKGAAQARRPAAPLPRSEPTKSKRSENKDVSESPLPTGTSAGKKVPAPAQPKADASKPHFAADPKRGRNDEQNFKATAGGDAVSPAFEDGTPASGYAVRVATPATETDNKQAVDHVLASEFQRRLSRRRAMLNPELAKALRGAASEKPADKAKNQIQKLESDEERTVHVLLVIRSVSSAVPPAAAVEADAADSPKD